MCHRVTQAILSSISCMGSPLQPGQRKSLGRSGGQSLPPYLVAVGAGAAELLHRILTARAVVLARAGEAGVALGHDVNVHWPWVAKPECGWQLSWKANSPLFPSARAPSHL